MLVMEKIYRGIIRILEYVAIFLGTVLVIDVVCNVACRYVFQTSIPWAEELSRFTFIWVIFIGAILANDRSEHMQLDFIVRALPKKISRLCTQLALLIVVVLVGMLVWGGVEYSVSQWDWMTSALHVRAGLVYGIAPVALCFLELQFIARLIQSLMPSRT